MKLIVLISCCLFGMDSFSQIDTNVTLHSIEEKYYNSYQENSIKFWGAEGGIFIGSENRFDLSTYSIGVSAKGYLSLYGLVYYNVSLYGGYSYLFDFQNNAQAFNHSIRLGSHFSFVGLETDVFFGKYDQVLWTVMPKVGVEWGHLSLFYGYHLPIINKSDMSWKNFHSVSLSYSICIGELFE